MIEYCVDDGIATLTWNVTDRPMNVINQVSAEAFGVAVERAIADERVKGIIITSDRREFVAGGDLQLILNIKTAEESMSITHRLSATLRTLERSPKPFVAAINGSALGGGLEICLACHRRIVADNPKIELGLPEVTLGLLPAAGGTQRLPRMIGIKHALPFLTEGRRLNPQAALKAGLVDEIVPATTLRERAREWLLAEGALHVVKPWDEKAFKFPGGAVQTSGVQQIFAGIAGQTLAKTQGIYPAPEAILACIYDGCQVDIDSGLKIEQRHFARLAISVTTKNLIRTKFFSIGEANRLARRPKEIPTRSFRKVGVLGAGMMGAGVAHVSAVAGLDVVLLDVSVESAKKGKSYSEKILSKQVANGRMDLETRDRILARVLPTDDYSMLSDCDIVIEAVFEDRQVKAETTRRAEAVLPDDAIFASNTSTLPITSLASASKRPHQFVGLHFFSPVEKMPLVEVIRGESTGDAAIAHAMDFVKLLRKTPILVGDCHSFYANRAFGRLPYEAMILLQEGVCPNLVENAARQAGMPMPTLALVDEFSIELLYKVLKQNRADQGDSYVEQGQDAVLVAMVEKSGRLGRKNGKGFYDYTPDGKRTLWPDLAQHFPTSTVQPSLEEVTKRLMYVQSVEAARCVSEGIVTPKDADVGSLLGWGFPAALGGAISQIDTIGAEQFVAECDRMAQIYGERFEVPAQLREMAACGERYVA
ncbi:3-hydroxyacyl-CoA dehydrogenase NAD-binding domain-containing protein [Noviherbaspirillum sedimenti]|uniref:3-hydroxyacyl-CoA dehydrogenase n=1 Tax=Noviherbaspirillum sedimenti TaxID=2320865 RepID=A0A3A3G2H0_9BURK|nr:3-hydroxyacyl-CoA dehydrogenase NAD-binding domain-containing protein [Noviherbaspirillum sedimenti]RJG02657.1 3-hydroxyacyl-CoA dehydrogenase [Noviherbaspirillum sedimenti]